MSVREPPPDYRLIKVPGDGSCAYHSLAQSLMKAHDRTKLPWCGQVRAEVGAYIAKNQEEMREWWHGNNADGEPTTWEQYLVEQEKDRTWAGPLELRTASLTWRTSIFVMCRKHLKGYALEVEKPKSRRLWWCCATTATLTTIGWTPEMEQHRRHERDCAVGSAGLKEGGKNCDDDDDGRANSRFTLSTGALASKAGAELRGMCGKPPSTRGSAFTFATRKGGRSSRAAGTDIPISVRKCHLKPSDRGASAWRRSQGRNEGQTQSESPSQDLDTDDEGDMNFDDNGRKGRESRSWGCP